MFRWYCGVSSVVVLIYRRIIGGFSWYYLIALITVLGCFLSYRGPYAFSPFFFVFFLWVSLMSCFSGLFLCRLLNGYLGFISSFIPVGTPLWICPLVCLAETISYFIRPLVLMLRPFINIGLGCVGMAVIGGFSIVNYWVLIAMIVIFFYELFVATVHWFIVSSILSFSIDH